MLSDLPANKTSRGAAKPMRENNVVQSQLAQCEARWRSARAFLHARGSRPGRMWRQTGEQTPEDRAMIRLASTWAIQQSREVVNTLYHATGSVAIFEDHPFEHRLRDIHTVAQQSQGRQLHYETGRPDPARHDAGKPVLNGGEDKMPAQSLNHYTILARDLEATKNFYTDVVGLAVGDRPPLNFPGYWLYCGGVPTVHLIGNRAEDAADQGRAADPAKTGRLDHIAFACEGLKDMKANLEQHSIKFDERVLPRLNMTQLFYYDPDGIAVECNFRGGDRGAVRSCPALSPGPSCEGRGAVRRAIPPPALPLRAP